MEFSEKDLERFIQAMDFAATQHRFQRRKGESSPAYFIHPVKVSRLLYEVGGIRDVEVLMAGLLHDTIEDTGALPEELIERFGERVTSIVCELTDDKKLPKATRKASQITNAAHKSPEAKAVKLADKIYNLADLVNDPPADWDKGRKQDYCLWAEKVVAGLRQPTEDGVSNANQGLLALFDETLANTRRVLDKIETEYADLGQNECQM